MAGRRMDRKTADSLKRLCLLALSLVLLLFRGEKTASQESRLT